MSGFRRCLMLQGLLVFACVQATHAHAQSPGADAPAATSAERDAQRLYDEGVVRAEAKDYDGASRAFAAAYRLAPGADALFAWAQVERLAGRCARAIELYDRFLAGQPTVEQAQAARLGRRRCDNATPPPREPSVRPTPAPTPMPARSVVAPLSLLTVGVLSVAGGVALVVLSQNAEEDAGKATRYDAYRSLMDRARLERGLGIGVGALGAALIVGGAVWWATDKRQADERVSWRLVPTGGGAFASLRGTF